MSKRVDPETKVCVAHSILGCVTCMVDDFRAAMAAMFLALAQRRAEAKATTVNERFDLGGES